MTSIGGMPFEKRDVPSVGTNRMAMNELADYLRRDLMISLDKAEGIVSAIKRVPLHHPTLCLVRNQKRILANHIREFDTTVRALTRGGTVLPEEQLRSPTSSTHTSPSASFSLSSMSSSLSDIQESETKAASTDVDTMVTLPPPLYPCDIVHANVRVIRFPSLTRLISAQRMLKASYPRAFYLSLELRERLRVGHNLPQVPIGWCWTVVRTSLSEVEVERLDWFFYL